MLVMFFVLYHLKARRWYFSPRGKVAFLTNKCTCIYVTKHSKHKCQIETSINETLKRTQRSCTIHKAQWVQENETLYVDGYGTFSRLVVGGCLPKHPVSPFW